MKNIEIKGHVSFPNSWIALFLLLLALLPGCTENVDTSARYVFVDRTVSDYLRSHSDVYGEYCRLLFQVPVSPVSKTTMGQLLSARGHYTVFAPTDKAVRAYLDSLVAGGLISSPSWEAFEDTLQRDSVRRVIVYNSIIDCGDRDLPFQTYDFPTTQGGEINTPSLSGRKLTVYHGQTTSDTLLIFNKYLINERNRDIVVTNGVIHQMEDVIIPQNQTAYDYLNDIVQHQKEGYLVMARAILACGLGDTLRAVRDEVYERKYLLGEIPDIRSRADIVGDDQVFYAPHHRLYGYNLFAEPDDYWRSQGLEPTDPRLLDKLTQWILDNRQYAREDQFTTDANYDDPANLLYQWTTYHILPQKMSSNKLVCHFNELGYSPDLPDRLSIPCYNIYTTMGQRRILKLYESKESEGVYLNRFPNLDNGRRGSYHELSCDADKVGCHVMREDPRAELSNIVNANIYPLDAPLSYNDATRQNLMKQRIRFEGPALFPEAITNNILLNPSRDSRSIYVYYPCDAVYRYCDDLWQTDQSYFFYLNYGGGNPSNMADEIKAGGRFDFTLRMPPVPRNGMYELRLGIIALSNRGACQIYLGTDLQNRVITGIPTDMRASVKSLGAWEPDTEDDDYNAEIDKRLRNLGYMKGCMHTGANGQRDLAMRYNNDSYFTCLRQILTRQFMDASKTYYLSFKNVLDVPKELYIDYFELVSKEVYDNPETPEDIW